MNSFAYQNGALFAENVALEKLATEFGTPLYVYSAPRIAENLAALRTALPGVFIHYAVKANSSQAVLKLIAKTGAGADIVSGGELARALAAGMKPQGIVFSGAGKSEEEIEAALKANIHMLNVESMAELEIISKVAVRLGKTAPITFRLNPDVAADTHHKISTGKKGDKFGIDHEQMLEAAALCKKLPNLKLSGVLLHIGSQIFDITTFEKAYQSGARFVRELRAAGHEITRLDLGGGMAVPYKGEAPFDLAAYAAMLKRTVGDLGCQLAIEPGRFVVADAGALLTRVVYVKEGVDTRFVVVDAAMNDLMRPALYDAYHNIRPVKASTEPPLPVDVVGPVCESSDIFGAARALPPVKAGDLLVLETAGAYGSSMAGTYNTRALVAEVLVNGDKAALIRPRFEVADQIARDKVPDWI